MYVDYTLNDKIKLNKFFTTRKTIDTVAASH